MTRRRSPAFEAGRRVGYALGLILCALAAGVLIAAAVLAAIRFH
jgi:hypothetical protein